MAKISAWVRKHIKPKPKPKETPKYEPPVKREISLPFLPSPRTSITLEPSTTPPCLLFQLPYEIRLIIYTFAFAGHRLHIEFWRSKNPDRWRWFGGICYRNHASISPSMPTNYLGPWIDRCRDFNALQYERQGRVYDDPQFNIGIFGFLLSCKQAYMEGINVLYSSNCISIKSEELLVNLPKLIPPNRLASITNLEVLVTAKMCDYTRPPSHQALLKPYGADHLKVILDNIATHCHSLRTFHLSLVAYSKNDFTLKTILAIDWLDDFCRSKPLRSMQVELPRDYFQEFVSDFAIGDHPLKDPARGVYKATLWRSLRVGFRNPNFHRVSFGRYPGPPLWLDGDHGKVEGPGYWLCEGYYYDSYREPTHRYGDWWSIAHDVIKSGGHL
ncbi:hypothetical protein M011DRAFT_471476 [Sporormia fimetaria CBS 119925]|uniref:DUF7730 domain-containing protein n=1 Tax=Sporormia fimetaria CBS 119925 TaxID=1340428 RepID=A0A6A6UYG3_9PLEO|nr:hypothetical protein M011DRAFT_471476 [Sporormia fimetaria CBS 119925]